VTEASDHEVARRWAARLVVVGLGFAVLAGESYRLGLPIAPDRVLLPAGIALFLMSGGLRDGGRPVWRTVHTLMLAMVLWTVWSALGHGTLTTDLGFFALLDRIVIPFALFVVAPLLFRDTASRQFLAKMLVVLGIYLGLTAVFEMFGPEALVFPQYILDPTAGLLPDRARGPGVSPENNGMVLAAALFVAATVGLRQFRGAWRWAAAVAVPLSATGVVLCLTRSVWLGTLLGAVAVIWLSPALRRRWPAIVGGVVAVGGGLLLAVPAFAETLTERLTTERSVFDRQNTNDAALSMIGQHPVDGVGWLRFVELNVDWVRQADTYPVTNVAIEVHNVVLSRAAELGLIGAALWVGAILAGPGLALISGPRDPELADWRLVLVGYACVWGTAIMVSPVPYPLPNDLLWLLAGMLLRKHLVERPLPAAPALAPPGTTR
jgi:putative inorganic carbon (hco3(-)) transporter